MKKSTNVLKKIVIKELHKPIIGKSKKSIVYLSCRDNICDADLADMQLISNYNKGIQFLLCVTDNLVNMHWLFLWKAKRVLQLLMIFKTL